MPANPKYLEKSSWHKFAKLSAGIIGGYILSSLIHMVVLLLYPSKNILITTIVSIYLLWVVFLIVPYLFKSGWKVWLVYSLAAISLYALYFYLNQQNPFV